jgi:hypothetical protein
VGWKVCEPDRKYEKEEIMCPLKKVLANAEMQKKKKNTLCHDMNAYEPVNKDGLESCVRSSI